MLSEFEPFKLLKAILLRISVFSRKDVPVPTFLGGRVWDTITPIDSLSRENSICLEGGLLGTKITNDFGQSRGRKHVFELLNDLV